MASSSRSILFCASLFVVACGEPAYEDCGSLPPVERGTGYAVKNAFEGRWQHTATLLDAPASSGLPLGMTTEPVLVGWVIYEDRIDATDADGPRFSMRLLQHVDDPNVSRAIVSPPCPDPDRPWYERRLAQVDWRMDTVAAPDALAFVPTASEIEPLVHVNTPTFSFSQERGTVSIGLRMMYRVTTDCERCEPADILVEHRFIRRFDLEDAA